MEIKINYSSKKRNKSLRIESYKKSEKRRKLNDSKFGFNYKMKCILINKT